MQRNKWQSRRWIVCIWAMALLSIIILIAYTLKIEPTWASTLVTGLLAIIGGWLGSETVTKPKEKPIEKGKGNEQ